MNQSLSTVALITALISGACYAAETSESPSAGTAKPIESKKPLDLKPADIRKFLKPDQIAKSISGHDVEKIEVVASPELLPQTDSETPKPWFGPMSVFWALFHPLHAWQIVAPVPSDQIQGLSGPPNLDEENLSSRPP